MSSYGASLTAGIMAAGNHAAMLTEFEFERRFDPSEVVRWMQDNWSMSFAICASYVALVFGGQHYMRPRPKMNLRMPMTVWSLSLAIFSIMGALRTGSFMLHIINNGGIRRSVCDLIFYDGPVSKFWAYAFMVSKVPELGDTVFIVLRKQRLIFLHWYHHITVLLFTWFSYKDMVAGFGWCMTMNYIVHAIMYSYYTARAAGLRVPRALAMVVTCAQLGQMVVGVVLTGLVYSWTQHGDCPSNMVNITCGGLMYFSYLLLFLNFFYNTYLQPNRSAKAE
ncbi:very long chain fatty acid elongase 6-like [Nerophis lumbriciformis]|uniref:very long chain fatty acid elongase 6-like n=1 Tax=Nerophis lumbriciformis TaxID=546530 RepID=UPI002AE004C4|nr:elongation of very long chain fatty acids protein 6-like [Nerophis lumbriciformis]